MYKLSTWNTEPTSPVNIQEGSSNELFDTIAAWKNVANQSSYLFQDDETKAKLAHDFSTKYKYGQAAINQFEGPYRSSTENLRHIAANSVRSVKNALQISDDVTTGDMDSNTPEVLARQHLQQVSAYTPKPLQNTSEALQRITQRHKEAQGFVEQLKATGDTIMDIGDQIINNPEGILELSAQSAGTMIPIMAGAMAGAKLATLATGATNPIAPVAGAIGGAVGTFTGGFATEAGYRFIQEADQELTKRGLDATEANYAMLLQDTSFLKPAIKRSRLKAVGTAAVDTVLAGVAGKVASSVTRKAKVLARMKVGATATTDVFEKAVGEELKNMSRGAKLKAHLMAVGIEQASEPFTEWTGQLAAGDKTDVGELVGEYLGGLGSSVAMVGVDKAVFSTKLTAGMTAAAATVATKKISNARVKADYKAKVAEALKTGEIQKYADPKSPDYQPIIAVSILHEQNLKEETTPLQQSQNYDATILLQEQVAEQVQTKISRLKEIAVKIKDKTVTKEELAERKTLKKEATDLMAAQETIAKTQENMQSTGRTDEALQAKAKDAVEKDDSIKIVEVVHDIIGSKNTGSDIEEFFDYDKVLNNKNIDTKTKKLVQALKDLGEQKQLVRESNKSTEGVSQDIFHGLGSFKGIDFYQQAIAAAITEGNIKEAYQQYKALAKFRDRHADKANTLQEALDAQEANKKMSPEGAAKLESLVAARGGKAFDINTGAFAGIIESIRVEAKALNVATVAAEQLFNSKDTLIDKVPAVTIQQGTTQQAEVIKPGTYSKKELATLNKNENKLSQNAWVEAALQIWKDYNTRNKRGTIKDEKVAREQLKQKYMLKFKTHEKINKKGIAPDQTMPYSMTENNNTFSDEEVSDLNKTRTTKLSEQELVAQQQEAENELMMAGVSEMENNSVSIQDLQDIPYSDLTQNTSEVTQEELDQITPTLEEKIKQSEQLNNSQATIKKIVTDIVTELSEKFSIKVNLTFSKGAIHTTTAIPQAHIASILKTNKGININFTQDSVVIAGVLKDFFSTKLGTLKYDDGSVETVLLDNTFDSTDKKIQEKEMIRRILIHEFMHTKVSNFNTDGSPKLLAVIEDEVNTLANNYIQSKETVLNGKESENESTVQTQKEKSSEGKTTEQNNKVDENLMINVVDENGNVTHEVNAKEELIRLEQEEEAYKALLKCMKTR